MLGIFITAGHPNPEKSLQALKVLDQAGVDLIEFGIPFSDPLLDGPVIQQSSHEALQNGMNLDKVFELVEQAQVKTNLILFSAYNPLHAYGFDRVIEKCKEHKVKGCLIPDLPIDEAEGLSKKFEENGLDLILLAALTSTRERLEMICKYSRPFVYLISKIGITGSAQSFKDNQELKDKVKEIKEILTAQGEDKFLAIGFGIDSPEKVKEVKELGADMAIIGTKTVKVLAEDQSSDANEFNSFVRSCMQLS